MKGPVKSRRARAPDAERCATDVSASPRRSGISLALLAGLAIVYLLWFVTSGGPRAQFYRLLSTAYVLLPDQLVRDLFAGWTGTDGTHVRLLDRLPIFGIAGWWFLASTSVGWLVLPRRLRDAMTPQEAFTFSGGVGLQISSLYALAVGLAGGLQQPWLWWGPSSLVTIAAAWRLIRRLPGQNGAVIPRLTGRDAGWWLLLAPPIVLMLLLAAVPPWEFDVREYHLQVPKEWFLEGRITFLPHNVYGNMPLGAEIHAAAAMALMPGSLGWWYGALAGKVTIALFTLLAASGLFLLARRWLSTSAAWVTAIVYVSTPWIIDVSSIGMNEGVLGAYYVLALAALVRAETSKTPLAWIGLGGFLAGGAVACKYPAIVMVVLPLLALVVIRTNKFRWRAAACFLVMTAAACGPWFVKNAVFTGNPSYPLLFRVFGGLAWDEATNERWRQAHGPPRDASGNQYSVTQLADSIGTLGWKSEKLSPLLWTLALFSPLAGTGRSWRRVMLSLLGVNFLAWWLLTHRMDRFFVPSFPLVALLAGFGVEALWEHVTARRIALGLVVLGVSVNCLFAGSAAMMGDKRILVELRELRRDESARLRSHPAHLYLNDHVPPGKSALLVGDAEVFDLEVPIYYDTCWNPCSLETWMKGKSRDERLQSLREHRVSHVFVHWPEIARYRSPGNYGFTDFVTPELVYGELVEKQRLLRPVTLRWGDRSGDPAWGAMFEVVDQP